jgi:hypothetical protein
MNEPYIVYGSKPVPVTVAASAVLAGDFTAS